MIMLQASREPEVALWNPPFMDAVLYSGTALIVVVGVHVFERVMSKRRPRSWWVLRDWMRSVVLAAVFVFVSWTIPHLLHGWLQVRPDIAVFLLFLGLEVSAFILGHAVHRDSGARAGPLAGMLAVLCLVVTIAAWWVGVGFAFLGPGLH